MRYVFGFLCVCVLGVVPLVGCSETGGTGGSTGDRQWGTAERIDNHDTGLRDAAQVAIDPAGNAVAVWAGLQSSVWSNRFTALGGWASAERIGSEGGDSGTQVAMDAQGAAIAVWSGIWSNRFAPSEEWGTARRISSEDRAVFPQVAMNGQGAAIAVWSGGNLGGTSHIWSNRFSVSGGWGTTERIESNDGNSHNPQVAIDAQGHALAVWSTWDGTRYTIWSNRFTPLEGWMTAKRIETNNEGSAGAVQVAMDPEGSAVAVWQQSSRIWSNRFTGSEGWGAAERIENNDEGYAEAPQVAMDAQGNAVAVWTQWIDSLRPLQIWSNRFTPSEGWGDAERIENNNDGNAESPQVAMDAEGNAVAVWRQLHDIVTPSHIWSNRFTPSGGWGAAERIENNNDSNAGYPQVAMNPEGDAVAVWVQLDGADRGVWSNRFHAGAGGNGGTGGTGGGAECDDHVCPCTEDGIRAAIAAGGDEPYTFNCAGPMTVVTGTEIVIDNDVILDGGGDLIVDGDQGHRVFLVAEGVTAELRRLTVTRGQTYERSGGGIANKGKLTISGCVVSSCRAGSLFPPSCAPACSWGGGGGITNLGEMTIIDSTISENQMGWGDGGGIYNDGTLVLMNSTVSGNGAGDGFGGGVHNGGTLTMTNSTVSGNSAGIDGFGGVGGGICNAGEMTIVNSTVSENSAGGLMRVSGGGILSYGRISLANTTISGNTADYADAIQTYDAYVEIAYTLIDGECDSRVAAEPNLTWVSLGYNIESPGDTCGFDQPTDQVNVSADDLKLGELADNGGPTKTHALEAGSEAINKIPADACELEEDQRGEPRPETGGTMCDVGAFELQP